MSEAALSYLVMCLPLFPPHREDEVEENVWKREEWRATTLKTLSSGPPLFFSQGARGEGVVEMSGQSASHQCSA